MDTSVTPKRRRKEIDHSLVKQILDGSQSDKDRAISELYEYYIPYFKHYFHSCLHNEDDAKDMANDFIIQILKNLTKFKFTYAFSTWARSVAHNYLIDCVRQKNRKVNTVSIDSSIPTDDGSSIVFELPSNSQTPYQVIEKKERYQDLNEKLKTLKPSYRLIIQLRYFQELSYAEIAEKLDISLGTVKAHLFRAKQEMRKLYE